MSAQGSVSMSPGRGATPTPRRETRFIVREVAPWWRWATASSRRLSIGGAAEGLSTEAELGSVHVWVCMSMDVCMCMSMNVCMCMNTGGHEYE